MKTRHYKELEMNELLIRFENNPDVKSALLDAQAALKKDKLAPAYTEIMRNSLKTWTTRALLASVFYWEETPQGHAFWKNLDARL